MLLSSPKARLITFFKTRSIKFHLNSQFMADPICTEYSHTFSNNDDILSQENNLYQVINNIKATD